MKSSEDQLPEELLDINKRILESIKSCLKNGLELLSAEHTWIVFKIFLPILNPAEYLVKIW